jgi:hypothetical protein
MRLSVISATVDRELDAIRERLKTYSSVAQLGDLVEVLRARAAAGDAVETIDLIGHSSQGVLVLGTTPLDDSPIVAIAMTEQLRPLLFDLGVRSLRLLGCSTATTERGRAALRRISLAARCDVLGTRRSIGRHDYGPAGFISEGALVGAAALAALIRSRSGIRGQSS